MKFKFALLVFYVAGTLSAPVLDERYPKENINIVECSATRFRPGTTFEYEYGGQTLHKVEGTTDKSTGLQLSAKVFITQLTGCNFHMKLTNVGFLSKSMDQQTFTPNAESAAFSEGLSKNAIVFTMKGNTVSSVRPLAGETTEMLNIKRGIISTLQLDETAATESDVNGMCSTKINKQDDGLVVKTKSLSECSDRTQEEIGIQSSSIKTASNLKPLDSKSTCKYTLDAASIKNVVCEESHLFRPFSAGYEKSSGATTLVRQTLSFIGEKPASNIKFDESTPMKGLLYDHAHEETKTADSMVPAIDDVMNRLVDQRHLSVKQTSAEEFTSLVRMFRTLDQKRMAVVWNRYFDCIASKVCAPNDSNMKDLYRQYMLDAIAYCGTPSCVSVVKEVTISGEVGGERANMFLQSISLLAKTTNSMIRDILDIAERRPSRQVFLTLGTLISRHCAKSPEECAPGYAVVQAENFLVKTLGDCSGQENHERVEEILLTLKAIGNAKRPVSAQSALITCAMNSKHNNITMSSFDALRGMECIGTTVTELRDFISNENIDADKRIYAFQASMKCSSTKDNIEKLVHQYNLETNKQMASFMWTYFTNLMESSDPGNRMAKTWLHEITTETPLKETNLPTYQYSKHFEKSLFIDSLQTGATAKADLVFHPDGFLPSTAVFDMTARVMGVPMDLVQTAVGIDGMETLLENVFGPDGALPQNFVLNMFNWTLTAEKLKEMVNRDAKNRERRSLKKALKRDEMPLVNDIHEAINMKPTQPSGFMSLKVMGQEVRIMSYDDIYAMIDQIDNMNVIQLLLNIAKGGKKTFSKSVMFLEMTHTVPTGLGFPLKLKLAGSTVGTVDLSGKFDIRNMFWGPGALSINGLVRPSAVVEIGGQMGTETRFISTGLRVTSNMMVSNELKGSIMYKEGNMLKINMDTPSEPVQLFKFSSTPFMFMNQHSNMIEGNARVIAKDACLKSQLIGYGMCTSIRMPVAFRDYEAPYFPFTGPSHFGVSLVRGDEKLTTFQFLTTMTKHADGFAGVMEFSTPNAAYERKLSAKMLYSDINNDKVLSLSTERFGRTGSLKVSYNTVSHRTSLETKNNFFTAKDIKTRMELFNQTSLAKQQFGIRMSAEYDWYKFEHVAKYVKKESIYMLESHTEYAPKKSITAALEYDTAQKRVRALFDVNQVRQAVELIGKLESTENEKGVSLMFVHVPTGKKTTFYTGYKAEANKKEIMTSLNVMGKSMKNILGWYKNGDIQSIEDFFVVQGKTAKFGASWEDRNGEKGLQFTADVFGKKATSTVIYTSSDALKSLDMSMRILGKEVSSTILLANKPDEKSLIMRLNSAAKPTEWSVAYYNKASLITLMLAGKALGNNAKLFWTLDTAAQYRSSLGFGFNKYAGGLRAETANKRSCASVYYSSGSEEKIATRTCVEYSNTDTDQLMHRRLAYSTELPALKLKLSLDNEISKGAGFTKIVSRILYNDAVKCTKTLDLIYNGLDNSAIKFDAKVGPYRGGMKLYSLKDGNVATTDIGFQLYAMDKTLTFLNKYDPSISKITSSLSTNKNTLPVTTEITYAYDGTSFKPTLKINVGEYGIGTGHDIRFGGNKYGASSTLIAITKGQKPLFRIITQNEIQTTGSKVTLVQNAGFTYLNDYYIYGWQWSYDNQSDGVKRIHEVAGRIQWSTSKYSMVTFTLANSNNKASLKVDVEYIPTKSVHHFITYNKNKQQLDVSVELLPKVYGKLTTTLDKMMGHQLTTNARFECKNCKAAFTMINSYVNNAQEFMISTNFASDSSVGLRITKKSPKSLTLFVNGLGNKVELIVVYENMGVEVRLNANEKNLLRLAGSYDQITTTFRMLAAKQEKVLFDVRSGYNKFVKGFKLAFAGLTKWGGVYVSTKGERTILNFDLLGKGFAKVIFNKKDKTLSIQSLRYPKLSLVFKLVPKSKTLSASVKTTKNRFTVNLRADWQNKIAAVHSFFNKEKVGVKLFFLKKAMILKVFIAQHHTLKATFLSKDNTLKVTLQRFVKGKVANQAVFKYALSNKLSEVMFKWDSELMNLIKPLIDNAATEVKELLQKIKSQDWKLIEISNDAKAKIVELVNKLDKAIGDFDFVPVRDFIVSSTVKALNNLSELTVKMLTTLATGLDKIKTNTPAVVQKLRELIKGAKATYIKLTKNMELKKEVIVAKVKMLVKIVEKIIKEGKEMMVKGIKEGKELITKGNEMLKALSNDIEQRLVPIIKAVTKATKNVSDATRPVVEKVIELAKNFKIRGLRMEEIVTKVILEGRGLLTSTIEKVKIILAKIEKEIRSKLTELKGRSTELFNKLKLDTIAMLKEAEEFVMKYQIPYTDKTTAQLIKTVKVEVTKFVKWLKSLDVKKIVEETKTTIDKLIKAKSAVVEKQIELLVNKYNELKVYLPAKAREFFDKVVKILNKYGKDIDLLVNHVSAFVKPMSKHIIFVGQSINKHFGPLLEKLIVELPNIRAILKPLLKPLAPLYTDLVGQVRKLNVMGLRMGAVFDMQVKEITRQMDALTTRINKELATLKTIVKELRTKTPNEVMTTSIEASVKILNNIVKFLNNLYKEKAMPTVNAAYTKLQAQYKKITSKSFDEITEDILKLSSDGVMTTAGELSSLIKQLVAMDISGPALKAIRELDVIGRLEKFGITEKLRQAIKYAKDANLASLVMKTITNIQELINLGVKKASIKALQTYARMEVVFKYLQSIPKKDYETWLNELADFTLSTKDVVSANLKKIHSTLQTQATKASEILEEMKKVDIAKYQKMMDKVIYAVNDFAIVVAQKSKLVYDDIKQPTIDVFELYRNLIAKQFVAIKTKLVTEYLPRLEEILKLVKVTLESAWDELKTKLTLKVNEIKMTAEKAYADAMAKYETFLSKYGDMTWEEIASKLEQAGVKEFEKVKAKIIMYYSKIVTKCIALKADVEAKVLKMYLMAASEYEKLIGTVVKIYGDLKTQITAKYEEIKANVMIYYAKCEKVYKTYEKLVKMEMAKLVIQTKAMCDKVKAQATEIYNKNKDKTLKQIYTEIKSFVTATLLKQKEILKAISEKNFAKAKQLLSEIQVKVIDQYRKVLVKVTGVIIPEIKTIIRNLDPKLQKVITELKFEAESITNQTLRNTVIIVKEIIKAYTPLVKATKDAAKQYIEVLKLEVPVITATLEALAKTGVEKMVQFYKTSIKVCEMKIKELIVKLKALVQTAIAKGEKLYEVGIAKCKTLIETIKKHDLYVEYVAILEKKLVLVKKMVQEQVAELKKNAVVIQIKEKIMELKEVLMEEIDRILKDPKFIELKKKVVLKITELKQFIKVSKQFITTKLAEINRFVELNVNERKAFVEQKINEVKWFVGIQISALRDYYQPKVQQLIKLLKQIKTSATFTAEKLQVYALPYVRDAVATALGYASAAPQLTGDALAYFAEAPEDAFWYGIEVMREVLEGAYLRTKSITSTEIETALLEFYMNVQAVTIDLYTKCTDDFTKQAVGAMVYMTYVEYYKLREQIRALPTIMKFFYEKNVAILKDILSGKFAALKVLVNDKLKTLETRVRAIFDSIPTIVRQQYTQAKILLKDTSAFLVSYTNSVIERIRNNIVFKTIVDNQIWGEIADEVKNHEIVVLTLKLKGLVTAKLVDLEKIVKEFIKTTEAMLKKEYAALKVKAEKLVTELKGVTLELYRKGTEEFKLAIVYVKEGYNFITTTTRKIFEETTIAEMVAFARQQYKQVAIKFNELKVKFVNDVTACIEECMAIIPKINMRNLVEKAKEIVEKCTAMLLKQPYSRIIIAKLENLSAYVVAKYEQLSADIIAKYGKQFTDVIAKWKKFSADVIAKYKEVSASIIAKYKVLVEALGEKFEKAMVMYNKYKTMAMDELKTLKEWAKAIESKIGAKVTIFKKMTIKETIAALKKIPTLIEKYTIMKFNQLKETLISEFKKASAKFQVIYKIVSEKVQAGQEKVQQLITKLEAKAKEVLTKLEPYLASAKKAYAVVEGEVYETAVFVYKYYHLEEKFNKVKEYVIAEIKKIIAATKKSFPALRETLKTYAGQYKSLLESYARDSEVFTRTATANLGKVALSLGDDILRGIHSGLVLIDTIDREAVMTKLRNIVDFVKEHVKIINKNGILIAKITHPDIKPTLNYIANVVKTTARKTMKQLKIKGKEMLKKIEVELPALKEKIRKLKAQIQEAVMESTFEIRRDLNISYKVNKNIAIRLYNVISQAVVDRAAHYNALKERVAAVMNTGKIMSEAYWKQFMLLLQEAYGKAETIITDISSSSTPKIMYNKIVTYIREAVDILATKFKPLIAPKLDTIKTALSSYLKIVKGKYEMLRHTLEMTLKNQKVTLQKMKDTAALIKKFVVASTERLGKFLNVVYDQLKTGIDAKEALKILKTIGGKWVDFTKEELVKIVKYLKGLGGMFCDDNAELCKLIDEGVEVHKMLLKKYVDRVAAFLFVGKAHVDRAVRRINTAVKDKRVGEKYLATAMIMGDHILTFDNKFYNFVNFTKVKKGARSPCSYLLARDFQDKKFTLSKLENAIIVETPEMNIKIRDDGNTRTTIGNAISFGLPVQSGSSKCVRLDNLILCHFKDQRMKITVDLKNFFTTISISGWYKGKSQGLLGTYNNEAHDDWRLPNNMITKNINQFANSYELSGIAQCQLSLETDNTKVCDGRTSKMCAAYFESDDSPFANVFNAVDPKPFMEACSQDTKCKKSKKALCSTVAAYVALLRTRGVWVPQINECMADKGRSVNEEWIQRPRKEIDVVVMVSQHKNMLKQKKSVAGTIMNLHKLLKEGRFNVRYALVGFGGEGVHERAHSHPLRRGPSVFGYALDLKREIKSMTFGGEGSTTNDGYHAILRASQLKFRPAAEKVFIMFNSEPHSSHATGPSFDETKYILGREANAPLFVFDTVNFARFGKAVGRVIGETERKLYTSNHVKGISNKNLELPASEFKELVTVSKGGLFSNAIKKPQQTATSLHDAVLNWVKRDMSLCKRCTLRSSWTGQSRPICVSDRTVQC